MIIVGEKNSIVYDGVKYLGDIKFSIPNQVLLQKNVEKCDRNTVRYSFSKVTLFYYLYNKLLNMQKGKASLTSSVVLLKTIKKWKQKRYCETRL
jgi:hypothetical protein